MAVLNRLFPSFPSLLLLTVLCVFGLGCGNGGNNNTANTPPRNIGTVASGTPPQPTGTAPANTPPTINPPSIPTIPTITPPLTPTTGGTPAPVPVPTITINPPTTLPNTTGLFQATLFSGFGSGSTILNNGQVILNANGIDGSGTVQISGAATSTLFTLMFCPFPSGKYACFPVTSLTTDASGLAQSSFRFPTGTWAGDFQVTTGGTPGGSIFATTGFNAAISNQSYTAELQAQTATNPVGINLIPVAAAPADPLTAGRVTVSGTNLQVTLQGAFPSATYNVLLCTLADGTGCVQQTTSVPTDTSGNANTTVPLSLQSGDIILVERSSLPTGVGFIAGFRSP